MKTIWTWHFNIRTAIESNSSEHWTVKAKRHKKQKLMIKKVFLSERPPVQPPCIVSITRIAPRELDEHDNLRVSLKWIADALAEYLVPGKANGRADDDKRIQWHFSQKKGLIREYGVYVKIETL